MTQKALLINCLSGRSGGAFSYLRNAIARIAKFHLSENAPEFQLKLLCSQKQAEAIQAPDEIESIVADTDNMSGYQRSFWEKKNLPRLAKEKSLAAIFTPYQMINSDAGVRNIVMVRNMEPFFYFNYPYAWKTRIRNFLLRRLTIKTARNAHKIIAVSQFVFDFLVEDIGIDRSKLEVIYHGRDTSFSEPETGFSPSQIGTFSCGKPFLLACGSMLPYRRNEDVIEAFAKIKDKHHCELVIAGDGDDNKYKTKLHKLREELGLKNKVHFVGHVSKQEMKWLYQNCEICVLSSEIEACPNIAIEAMTSGCCLISSSHRPLPEIIGPDASISYPSRDSTAIADAINELLSSPEQRQKLKEQASTRSQKYCWDQCAVNTYEFLRNQI